MTRGMLWSVIAVLGLLSAATTSRSDTPAGSDGTASGMPTSMPATEPLGPNPPKDPFAPFEADPGAVPYEALPLAERDVVDRARAQAAQLDAVGAVYAAASAEEYQRGLAAMAQASLGLEDLGDVGVVP